MKNHWLNKTGIYVAFLLTGIFIFTPAFFVLAQSPDSIGLTIAPPLVKNKMQPGESWPSSLKVVNNSLSEINIYAEVMNYKSGENGGPEFIQNDTDAPDSATYSLKEWVKIETGPYTIPAQQSADIPYTIALPDNASPGGHYAAILIGTKPVGDIKGTGIKISSYLASLLMIQVAGDITEKGQIREFSVDKTVFTEPAVNFRMTFENTGNVDLQPQGEIRISDWFGKTKGNITINHATDYGNVLPKSMRKWDFDWSQEKSLFDMGRYRADLIIGYGREARETVNQTLHFWLVYPKPLALALFSTFFLILLIFLAIKLYIRRAIIATTKEAGLIMPHGELRNKKISVIPEDQNGGDYHTTIKQRTNLRSDPAPRSFKGLIRFLWVVIIILILIAVAFYFYDRRPIAEKVINIDQPASNETLPVVEPRGEEQIIETSEVPVETAATTSIIDKADTASSTATTTPAEGLKTTLRISVLNGSGLAGAGNKAEAKLIAGGYAVARVANADNFNFTTTVIRYKPGNTQTAEKLGQAVFADFELEEVADLEDDITVIIGKNFQP